MIAIGEILVNAAFFWISLFILEKYLAWQFPVGWTLCKAKLGLNFSLTRISWSTTRLNRLFFTLADIFPTFLDHWFSIGVIVGFLGTLGSLCLLLINLVHILKAPSQEPILVPVIPGMNVPRQQLVYYFLALCLSAIFHEFGHAIAASRERIRLNSFGIFVFFIFPGAFIDFGSDFDITLLSTWKRLKIFCAGSWHNVFQSLICYFLLVTFPIIMFPFFHHLTEGIVVIPVEKNSFMADNSGSYFGQHREIIIKDLSGCHTNGRNDWEACFSYLLDNEYQGSGFCVNESFIEEQLKSNELACCDNLYEDPSMQCFEVINGGLVFRNVCTSAKELANGDNVHCRMDDDCPNYEFRRCVRLIETNKGETLVKLTMIDGSSVIFWGHPLSLWFSLEVSEYVPRHLWKLLFDSSTPSKFEKLLKYLLSISAALGLLNLLPIFYLDGQWSCDAFISLLCSSSVSARRRNHWCQRIYLASSILLAANIFASFIQFVFMIL